MTDDEALLHTVAFAIGKTKLRPRAKDARVNDADMKIAARTILDHLALSGYVLTKKQPGAAHSIP